MSDETKKEIPPDKLVRVTFMPEGKTVEFEGPEVERWAASVARAARFHDVSHTVEIFGTCDECARGRAAGAGHRHEVADRFHSKRRGGRNMRERCLAPTAS